MGAERAGGSGGRLGWLSLARDDAEADALAERGGLLQAAFVRTAAFEAVLAGRKHVVIGRGGSGKSAICRGLMARSGGAFTAALVTPGEVSPDELRRVEQQGALAGVSALLLWRYVLGVLVARYVVAHAAQVHGKQVPRSTEVLRKFLADNGEETDLRLHRPLSAYVGRLRSVSLGAFGATLGVEVGEQAEARRPSDKVEALERGVLAALEDLASPPGYPRLLLLADELEQMWTGDSWSSMLMSGLLLAARHVTRTFPRVECVVFIRTDIYDALRFPQKDRFRGEEVRVSWAAEGLRELALARARASTGCQMEAAELWGGLFPAVIDDRPAVDYLISRTLGRPRDLIQLTGKCREIAADRGHRAVAPADVREAEAEFSAWKRQDLEAEYEVSYPFLPAVLVLFQDSTYIVSRQRLDSLLSGGLPSLRERFPEHAVTLTPQAITGILYQAGFLGMRRAQRVVYSHQGTARPHPDERAFYIHPCFRPALGAVRASSVHQSETWRIGIWGPSGSGKTTFIAALNNAASQSQAKPIIYGTDDNSIRHLEYLTRMLGASGEFPNQTLTRNSLSFGLNIPALRPSAQIAAPALPTQFNIEMTDAPGTYFYPRGHDREDLPEAGEHDRFLDTLSESDGFVLLIDPHMLRENMAYDSIGDILLEVAQRCFARERVGDGWLPQYMAVCIAKFDDPDVYQWAASGGRCHARADDPHGFPSIPDDEAMGFFADLCRENNASAVLDAIVRYFHPDRTRYFVTSSIGFHLPGDGAQFNERDYLNKLRDADGFPLQIRGRIYPINVIEPVIWLGQCLTTIEE